MTTPQIVNHLYNILCKRGSDATIALIGMGFVRLDFTHGACLTERGHTFLLPHL